LAHEVIFAPEAEDDLVRLYDYIAGEASPGRAYDYVEAIRCYCVDFSMFPQRGTRRDDLRPGLRITGFRRRVTIAFHLNAGTVVIDRIFYGGRDVEGFFAQN